MSPNTARDNTSADNLYFDRDRIPFDVLLTAVAPDTVLSHIQPRDMPDFDDKPRWIVKQEAAIAKDDYFDLAVVLCAQVVHLAESASLVRRLTDRRIATVLLVPAALNPFLSDIPTLLTVVAPGDLGQGIRMLTHTLLAPAQQDGLVCCDWMDILDTMRDGARAQLVSAEAPSAAEAVRALAERLAPLATGEGYGVVATLYIGATDRMRDWYSLLNVVKATTRQDAMVLASAPVTKRSASIAVAMVLTAPSFHYFRNPIRSEPAA